MAWQSLSATLGNKPHVLAGPVLRKVTSQEVTVWFALRRACSITLKVFQGNTVILAGTGSTVAVGVNLHIVAVTADKLEPPHAGLIEGVVYEYDAIFDFGNLQNALSGATNGASLAYPPFTRPSFCLPPANVNQLRLIHGSCRIPHGNGPDALPLLDGLIAQGASNPYARPHQLMLTGDQIYADDVGYAMSMMLSDAAQAMLGWDETLMCNQPYQKRRKVSEFHPGLREANMIPEEGFTSVDKRGQLIGLGEYLAMYLFVWSDALWPSGTTTLPDYDEIVSFFSSRYDSVDFEAAHSDMLRMEWLDRKDVESETGRTRSFRGGLIEVRRALANIPSYMIFDDHEITDDWNMTREICRGMYGNELGLRVVQNALVAYSLCQHWGNVPDQFSSKTGIMPGVKLLLQLDGTNAVHYENSSPTIRTLLGVHDDTALASRPDGGLFHDAGSLIYNYTVEGPGHQIIVTDTRTWRSFPRGAADAGDFLPGAQLDRQIVNTPPTRDRALLVVLTTNAPPVEPIRSTTRHPDITRTAAATFEGDPSPDIYEAWELPAKATDRLYRAISEKLPLFQMPFLGSVRTGHAILLSGDVHTSFASRLLFKATARFEDPQASPQPVSAVYAQLVASSFRKQTGNTIGQHKDGYTYAPKWIIKKILIPDHKPEGYIGWNLPAGVKKRVAKIKNNPGSGNSYTPVKINGPTTVSMWDLSFGMVAEVTPDYSYRLDYLFAVLEGGLPSTPPPIPPMPTGTTDEDRKRAADAYHKATGSYRKFNTANVTRREIVGVNNIAEITFDWLANGDRFVLHTLRWHDQGTGNLTFTTYVVSLNQNDPTYPEIKPLQP